MASGFRPAGSGGGSGGLLAGDVSGPFLSNVINPGVVTGGAAGPSFSKIAANTITQYNLAGDALPFLNLLTNPGLNFAQLWPPASVNTIPDNNVSADAWKVTHQNADVTFQRLSNNAASGWTSANRGRFTKITNPGKFMVYQPLESLITQAVENQEISFTMRLNLSTAHLMRIGFFRYGGGSPNVVVPAPVSAWNGAGVAPTLNAGFALDQSFAFSAPIGLSGWAVVVNYTGGFGANDTLCVFVMADESFAVNDYFDLGECVLDIGSVGQFNYKPLTEFEDVGRCERLIEKSYDIDTPPATVTLLNSRAFSQVGANCNLAIPYRTRKILSTLPVITLYSPVTGATGEFADITSAADVAVTASDEGLSSTNVASAAAADNDRLKGHYLINGSL